MGAGKTTVGAYLAKKLGVKFLDSDHLIEEQAGATIPEIFERDGEDFFRKVEAKTIKKVLSERGSIILATGGGAFMNEQTRKIINEKSASIWLYADLNELVKRVQANDSRPLLNNVDKKQVLAKLIEERYPVYEQARIMVDTSSNSRTIIGNDIIKKLQAEKLI